MENKYNGCKTVKSKLSGNSKGNNKVEKLRKQVRCLREEIRQIRQYKHNYKEQRNNSSSSNWDYRPQAEREQDDSDRRRNRYSDDTLGCWGP